MSYQRSMSGWWRRRAFFRAYMLRELTAFAVFGYSVVLMIGLVRFSQGEAAWNNYLSALRSPMGLGLTILFLVSMAIHTKSWFEIMPKTMPILRFRGQRVQADQITRLGLLVSLCSMLLVLCVVWISA